MCRSSTICIYLVYMLETTNNMLCHKIPFLCTAYFTKLFRYHLLQGDLLPPIYRQKLSRGRRSEIEKDNEVIYRCFMFSGLHFVYFPNYFYQFVLV